MSLHVVSASDTTLEVTFGDCAVKARVYAEGKMHGRICWDAAVYHPVIRLPDWRVVRPGCRGVLHGRRLAPGDTLLADELRFRQLATAILGDSLAPGVYGVVVDVRLNQRGYTLPAGRVELRRPTPLPGR